MAMSMLALMEYETKKLEHLNWMLDQIEQSQRARERQEEVMEKRRGIH